MTPSVGPSPASASASASAPDPLLRFFNSAPCYTLVTPASAPYCVVNSDAKIVSYYFPSLTSCESVLKSCLSSDSKSAPDSRIYKGATVGHLPMSQVYLLSLLRNVQGQYYRFSASDEALADALDRTNVERLPDGKVRESGAQGSKSAPSRLLQSHNRRF